MLELHPPDQIEEFAHSVAKKPILNPPLCETSQNAVTSNVKVRKYGAGRRKRLNSVSKKAANFKGFGQPFEGQFEWYMIEWNYEWYSEEGLEVDLIELHWVKVLKPNKKQRQFFESAMLLAGINNPDISVEDFFASMFLGYCSDQGKVPAANTGLLYRATHKGDTKPRDPIGQLHGRWDEQKEFKDSLVDTVAFKHCFIDEVVPGDQVTWKSKRLKR